MGMTIDEVIKELEWALANNTIEDVESAFKYISAIHIALDTMRKYQKIEEILKEPCIIPEGCYPMLKKIREVVKDGNDCR